MSIRLGMDILPSDIIIRRSLDDLVLRINNTSDLLTIQSYFRNNSPLNKIERIQFADGTVWGDSDILQKILLSTEGDDTI